MYVLWLQAKFLALFFLYLSSTTRAGLLQFSYDLTWIMVSRANILLIAFLKQTL